MGKIPALLCCFFVSQPAVANIGPADFSDVLQNAEGPFKIDGAEAAYRDPIWKPEGPVLKIEGVKISDDSNPELVRLKEEIAQLQAALKKLDFWAKGANHLAGELRIFAQTTRRALNRASCINESLGVEMSCRDYGSLEFTQIPQGGVPQAAVAHFDDFQSPEERQKYYQTQFNYFKEAHATAKQLVGYRLGQLQDFADKGVVYDRGFMGRSPAIEALCGESPGIETIPPLLDVIAARLHNLIPEGPAKQSAMGQFNAKKDQLIKLCTDSREIHKIVGSWAKSVLHGQGTLDAIADAYRGPQAALDSEVASWKIMADIKKANSKEELAKEGTRHIHTFITQFQQEDEWLGEAVASKDAQGSPAQNVALRYQAVMAGDSAAIAPSAAVTGTVKSFVSFGKSAKILEGPQTIGSPESVRIGVAPATSHGIQIGQTIPVARPAPPASAPRPDFGIPEGKPSKWVVGKETLELRRTNGVAQIKIGGDWTPIKNWQDGEKNMHIITEDGWDISVNKASKVVEKKRLAAQHARDF